MHIPSVLMVAALLAGAAAGPLAAQEAGKPNILVIWGGDIGRSNISAYTRGLMGSQTPNIDRVAAEGMMFTDYYGEQSCRAGRSSFIMGQSVYHADGQISDEVFVYESFLQSKMYAAGVGCLNCHDAHTAQLVAEGNAVCTQCHTPTGRSDFPTVPKADYDTPAHHFHDPDTDGAQCKSCHAPAQVYMGNDWRADHSFRVPRPDLSALTGAPDACTTCHTDRDPAWAATEIAVRFPDSANRGPHYGLTLARGFEQATTTATTTAATTAATTAGDLAALATDTGQPGIARATALWLMETTGDPEMAAHVAPLLADGDPLVRAAAVGAQRMADPQDRVLRLLPLLADPVRSVRMDAARALLDAPIARLPRTAQADLDAAMAEWRAALSSRLDFPETHLQLAGIALTLRAFPQAEAAFREVVHLDPQRTEAWVMLVRLAAASGGTQAARAVLDQALKAVPDNPSLVALGRDLGIRN